MTDLVSQLVAILGALGFGTVLGGWINGAKGRRQDAAEVARTLSVLAISMRPEPGGGNRDKFWADKHAFQTAAIIAGVPPEPVRVHLRCADFIYRVASHDPEPAPGISDYRPMTLDEAEEVLATESESARLIARLLRSGPVYRRVVGRRRLRSKSSRVENRMEQTVNEHWTKAWGHAGEVTF